MKIIVAAAVILFALMSGASHAVVTSFGNSDCGEWINKSNDYRKAWLLGYLSGANAMFEAVRDKRKAVPNPLGSLRSAEQAYLWMNTYCQKNPLSSVADGADILIVELISMTKKPGK